MTPEAKILRALRNSGNGGIPAEDLAKSAGLTRTTLAERIEELQRLGYSIESTPHYGYRLVIATDALNADDLLSRLGEEPIIGRDIRVFQETTSTNDVVEKLARDGVGEGIVVFAETQTKGRGRLGRKWISPHGEGLWFSILLRPELPLVSATQITVAAAVAIARAISSTANLIPQIKWPNDLLFDGKKAGGILTELAAEVDRIRHIVLGIGIDVNTTKFPTELRTIATSLAMEAGSSLSRPELAGACLRELDFDYRRIREGQFAAVAEEWERQCITLGRRVRVRVGEHDVIGCAESLDNDGALLVRTEHGRLERVMGGDVVIEG